MPFQDQASGGDSAVMSLREALQLTERAGLIAFSLGGHSCERPPEVTQGRQDDEFSIAPDPGCQLLWRANSIAVKSLKCTNIASHFPFSKLSESPLELVTCLQRLQKERLESIGDEVWRIRTYKAEKCVAAAKPLWYLSADLSLQKDECKRII